MYISNIKISILFFLPLTDTIDVVKDQLYGADYVKEEDPTGYRSQKTGRGPLNENWLTDYWNECKVFRRREFKK